MVYLLDPTVPRVWRSPHALQFGVERPRLVLDPVDSADERMVAALGGGAALGALRLIARNAGAEPGAADALLARLKPVLATAPGPTGTQPSADAPIVILDGAGPTAARIVALLREAGVDARSGLAADDPAVEEAAAAVVVASYAVAPHRHARWLRRDIPHLAVVFGDAGVTVGPFVRPGAGACVRCVDLHRRDGDPAWPVLAAQLHTRPVPGETELVCGAVASAAAGVLLAALADRGTARGHVSTGQVPMGHVSTAARYDSATARWSELAWEPHPECGCLTPLAARPAPERARPRTATAGATPAVPAECPAAPSSDAGASARG